MIEFIIFYIIFFMFAGVILIAVGDESRIYFAWYDLWIGFYYDRSKRIIYYCPLPCLVIECKLSQWGR